ncbi:DUF2513 domain-containing protein [Devosia sp. MC521]|uniref:DUF2513 domain-containing protein n=1 Tax=Devosia sp. MC521 TaxID=2759954 RepID=UPI0015FBAB69|nr:DUF2513 domain-containing protein [Devosia sp. MC521]MBJ6986907.1 DUF2513 domain-containing protein [Devosia sp. MC521]QMW63933.1 DUF2513 domain-containing protein [Devosia sp. MC521]
MLPNPVDVAIRVARVKVSHLEGREDDMKRDMEVVRKVLKAIQDRADAKPVYLEIDGIEDDVVALHVALLHEAGYIRGIAFTTLSDQFARIAVQDLTWQGHEFAGALLTDDGTWQKVKTAFGPEKLATAPLKMIENVTTQALTAWAIKQIGL